MIVSVKLFAAARQQAGNSVVALELPRGATVGDLRRQLTAGHPSLASWGTHLMIAVDRQYAPDDMSLEPDSEIACFPPVSGG